MMVVRIVVIGVQKERGGLAVVEKRRRTPRRLYATTRDRSGESLTILHLQRLKSCFNVAQFERIGQTPDLKTGCEDAETKGEDDQVEDLFHCREVKE